MAAEIKKEIGHVLFIDIVGYSKLLIGFISTLDSRLLDFSPYRFRNRRQRPNASPA